MSIFVQLFSTNIRIRREQILNINKSDTQSGTASDVVVAMRGICDWISALI